MEISRGSVHLQTVAGEGGGGTSPAVPIVIVMAILGALSIGVVLYRERRQRLVG